MILKQDRQKHLGKYLRIYLAMCANGFGVLLIFVLLKKYVIPLIAPFFAPAMENLFFAFCHSLSLHPMWVFQCLQLVGVFPLLFVLYFVSLWLAGKVAGVPLRIHVRFCFAVAVAVYSAFIWDNSWGLECSSYLYTFLATQQVSNSHFDGIMAVYNVCFPTLFFSIVYGFMFSPISSRTIVIVITIPAMVLFFIIYALKLGDWPTSLNPILFMLYLFYLCGLPFFLHIQSPTHYPIPFLSRNRLFNAVFPIFLGISLLVNGFLIHQKTSRSTTPLFDQPRRIEMSAIQTIDELLTFPDEEIHFSDAAMLLAGDLNATLNVRDCVDQINQTARELHQRMNRYQSPQENLKIMADYLFQDYIGGENDKIVQFYSRFGLDGLIGHGPCFAGSLLYLMVAERIGFPLKMMFIYSIPHALISYQDEHFQFYVETTDNGTIIPDFSHYLQQFDPNSMYSLLDKRETISAVIHQVGTMWRERGKLDRAYAAFQKAVEIAPDFPIVRAQLGSFFLDYLNKPEKAVVELTQAVTLSPNYYTAHLILGKAYHVLNDLDHAEIEWRTALQCKPDSAEAMNNMGIIYEQKKDWVQAMEHYLQSVALMPSNIHGVYNLGRIYCKLEDYEQAIPYLQKAKTMQQNNPDLLSLLGFAYQKTGDYSHAIEEYENTLRFAPDFSNVRHSLNDTLREWHLLTEYKHPNIDPANPLAPYDY
jgi:tetratricopeptide (TPR) repeat protein